jgi:hypothetical protein
MGGAHLGSSGRATANKMWMSRKSFFLPGIFLLKTNNHSFSKKNYKRILRLRSQFVTASVAEAPGLIFEPGRLPASVISGYFATFARCPLYPQKRTLFSTVVMSAKCQKQTFVEPRVHFFAGAWFRNSRQRIARVTIELEGPETSIFAPRFVRQRGSAYEAALHFISPR